MSSGVRGVALAVVVLLVAGLAYKIVHRATAPVIPAVIVRDADAHRLLSASLMARVDRYLHDRPPPLERRGGSPRLVALTFDDGPYPVETAFASGRASATSRACDIFSRRSRFRAVSGPRAADRA